MSETSSITPDVSSLTTGRVVSVEGSAVVLKLAGTDYQLLLQCRGALPAEGSKVTGVIAAKAKRVDVVPAGGRYIEPVAGRPRRVQGRVVAGDTGKNTLTVKAATAVVVSLMDLQKTADFSVGQLVSFDVEPGATFEPVSSAVSA
ncbi:hypothetical protein [Mucisphaera sp.]|uniref:hypothetical protein n=1 Tax=Mucisphaera sp. TaxID=2913024 RepID=UPI003D12075E